MKQGFDKEMEIMATKLKVLRGTKVSVTIALIIFVAAFIMPENAISKWYIPIACSLGGISLLFAKLFWNYYGRSYKIKIQE